MKLSIPDYECEIDWKKKEFIVTQIYTYQNRITLSTVKLMEKNGQSNIDILILTN
jgi:hypothetical protein